MWSVCSWEMTMPSRRSIECASAASRRSVSRFPSPASTSRRVRGVSKSVQLPELPDARMLRRRLMDSPPETAPQHAQRPARRGPGSRATSHAARAYSPEKKRGRRHHRKSGGGASIRFEGVCDQKFSAGQQIAGQAEAVERADHRSGNLPRLEEFDSRLLHVLEGHGFDGGVQLLDAEEVAEVDLLARQVGHARPGRFERKHQRTLELILGAPELVHADKFFLQTRKFTGDGTQHSLGGAAARARIDRKHARIGVRIEFAEDGVGESLAFADILKQPGGHASAQNIIQY